MSKIVEEYIPSELEDKGIKEGEKQALYRFTDDGREKKLYILDMFPYPSGSGLHVGHLKGYLATDILTRYYTMKGYLVFHPMGGDAFGLPAEQYAIKTGNSPKEFTQQNIDNFRKQLKRLMLTYDFQYEVDTSSPEYYRQTQGIFSEMYERGLAKYVDTQVNGCEELNTVLSDEEIVEEGTKLFSERGNYPVVRKKMKQGVLKITKYADSLLEGIDDLSGPDNVKKIQQAGIGASNKYEYPLQFSNKIYPLYLKYCSSIRKLKGVGIHQFSELSKNLNLTPENTGNKQLIEKVKLINLVDYKPIDVYYLGDIDFRADELIPIFNEGTEDDFYDEEIEKYYLKQERIPTLQKIYKLKDGVFSRQRFGGEPIPILFNENNEPSLDKSLPVTLPDTVDYQTSRHGQSPLANNKEGLEVIRDGKKYTRESSTMPNGAGSSGYFIAYLLKKKDGTYGDLGTEEAQRILNRGLPVDIYVGGQEHAAMHLLYARFWHKFLKNIGILNTPEPFHTLLNQGMVLGVDGTKMSKSKGNYVSIDEIIEEYGADTLRVYEAFSGPTQLSFTGDNNGLRASHKGLHKVNIFFQSLDELEETDDEDKEVCEIENRLISNVEKAIPNLKINLGVSEMMIFINEIQKIKKYSFKSLDSFAQILSLYAPALAEEIGSVRLNREGFIYHSTGPTLNVLDEQEIPNYKVFVDGKFKFMVRCENEEQMKKEIKEFLGDKYDLEMQIMNSKKIVLVRTGTTK